MLCAKLTMIKIVKGERVYSELYVDVNKVIGFYKSKIDNCTSIRVCNGDYFPVAEETAEVINAIKNAIEV